MIGVRILGGRIHIGQRLLKDGVVVGQIKSIRRGEETKKEAIQGDEVAIAVDGVTVGRQIDEQDVLLVDVPEKHAKRLAKMSLMPRKRKFWRSCCRSTVAMTTSGVDDRFHFQGPNPLMRIDPVEHRL